MHHHTQSNFRSLICLCSFNFLVFSPILCEHPLGCHNSYWHSCRIWQHHLEYAWYCKLFLLPCSMHFPSFYTRKLSCIGRRICKCVLEVTKPNCMLCICNVCCIWFALISMYTRHVWYVSHVITVTQVSSISWCPTHPWVDSVDDTNDTVTMLHTLHIFYL